MTLDLLLTQDQGSSIVDGINHLRRRILSQRLKRDGQQKIEERFIEYSQFEKWLTGESGKYKCVPVDDKQLYEIYIRHSVNCYTKQVLGTNAPIRLQQYDEAFWERIEIIPYIHSIDTNNRIDNLEDLLFEERDAIVTKCLKAARDLLKNNYEFPPCPVAEEMKNAWIGWNMHAKEFLLTNCLAEEGAYTPSSQLYGTYVQYCQDHSLPYGSKKAFICYAKELFPSDGNPHRMINGVQLRGLPDVRFLGEY